jgi:hypothetical protein
MIEDSFGGTLPSKQFHCPVKVNQGYKDTEKLLQISLRMDSAFADCMVTIAIAREHYMAKYDHLILECEHKCRLEVDQFLNTFIELPDDHILLQQKFQDHIRPKTDFLREQCKLRLDSLNNMVQENMKDQIKEYCGKVQGAMVERLSNSVMWEEMTALDQYQLLKRAAERRASKESNGQDCDI